MAHRYHHDGSRAGLSSALVTAISSACVHKTEVPQGERMKLTSKSKDKESLGQ